MVPHASADQMVPLVPYYESDVATPTDFFATGGEGVHGGHADGCAVAVQAPAVQRHLRADNLTDEVARREDRMRQALAVQRERGLTNEFAAVLDDDGRHGEFARDVDKNNGFSAARGEGGEHGTNAGLAPLVVYAVL